MRKLVAALSVISFTFGLAIGYHFLKSEKRVIICEADPVSNVESYYSSITSNMKGDTLKVALYNIIKGHDKRDYDSIEQDLKYTDRNWTLSPKEDDENPKMILLYADYNTTSPCEWNLFQGGGKNGGVSTGYIWNKEHIWAKSNGFNTKSLAAYSDLHHLRASDWKCNNTRGNNPFGNVSNGSKVDNAYGNKTDNKSGGGFFEPADEYKGDCARALFYMATRYYNGDGSGGTHLNLIDKDNSDNIPVGTWENLSTLLSWNELDPVDEFEMNRNNLIYERYQHNRNPYIDHPEYARAVFKNEEMGEPKTIVDLTISGSPNKTEYKAGQYFDPTGLTITAEFDDNSSTNVTSSVKWSPSPLVEGTTKVVGTYTYSTVSKTIEVSGLTVTANNTPDTPVDGETMTIEFKTNGSESVEIKGNSLLDYIGEGKNYVSSVSDVAKIYGSSYGIKMGSSKENGSFKFNLNKSYKVSSITLNAKAYGNDESSINVSTNVNQAGINNAIPTSFEDVTYTFDGSEISFIKLVTTKRVYLASISIECVADTPDIPDTPDEPDTPDTPDIPDTPSQSSSNGCGGNIYTSSMILSALSMMFVVSLILTKKKRIK